MEDEQPLRSIRGLSNSVVRMPTISTSFTLLTRYTARLINSDHHRTLLGDCTEPRFDGDGEYDDDYHRRFLIGDDYVYSKPILVLDTVWNLAFVLVSVLVLLSTFRERPSTPLRLWLSGHTLQCFLHVIFVFFEYQRSNLPYGFVFEQRGAQSWFSLSQRSNSIMKTVESLNTTVSSIWWVFGFYWIVMGGQALLQDAPRLYWLTVVFLAFDVFFILFCIGMACFVFFIFCCCVPVVTLAYTMINRQGASEDDIRTLPKFRFSQTNQLETFDSDRKQLVEECCICLSQYIDGDELCSLPCNHHFHCGCISKWLRINATCPLCKFNILRGDTLV